MWTIVKQVTECDSFYTVVFNIKYVYCVTFGYKVQPDNVRDVCLPCNILFIYNILSAMNNN